MVKCSKLGEKHRAPWCQVRKGGAMTNFRQKCTIENRERNMHRKFHKNQKMVKCSKLREKNCGIRCEMSQVHQMSEGERTRAWHVKNKF